MRIILETVLVVQLSRDHYVLHLFINVHRTNVGTRINLEYIIIPLKEKPNYFQKMLIY